MTPQQKKADELVERFYKMLSSDFNEDELVSTSVINFKRDATKCAIICVEEILKADPPPLTVNEWNEVLNELKSRL